MVGWASKRDRKVTLACGHTTAVNERRDSRLQLVLPKKAQCADCTFGFCVNHDHYETEGGTRCRNCKGYWQ